MYWFCLSLECAWIKKKISLLFYPAILSNNINRFKIFTSSKKHIPGKEDRQKKSEITNTKNQLGIRFFRLTLLSRSSLHALVLHWFELRSFKKISWHQPIRGKPTTRRHFPALWTSKMSLHRVLIGSRNWLPVFWLVRANQWRPSRTHFPRLGSRLHECTFLEFWLVHKINYVRSEWPDDQYEMNQN